MPHLPDQPRHHDPALIAALAAGDAEGADLEQAARPRRRVRRVRRPPP